MSWNANNEKTWQTDQLEEAKRRFENSEWILNMLRTQTGSPTAPASNDEILLWNTKLNTNQN